MQLYMSWYIRSFFGFTFLNILYCFKYSCTNIFHRRSLYTFYHIYAQHDSLLGLNITAYDIKDIKSTETHPLSGFFFQNNINQVSITMAPDIAKIIADGIYCIKLNIILSCDCVIWGRGNLSNRLYIFLKTQFCWMKWRFALVGIQVTILLNVR